MSNAGERRWAMEYSRRFPVTPWRALEIRRETLACLVDVVGMSKEEAEGQVEEVVELAGSLAQHHNLPIEEALKVAWGSEPHPDGAEHAFDQLRQAWRELLRAVGKALHLDEMLDWIEYWLDR